MFCLKSKEHPKPKEPEKPKAKEVRQGLAPILLLP
jgi:hypothetical protein